MSILGVPAGSLIVSCQAPTGSALDSPTVISALAGAAAEGGAKAVRIEGVADVAQVRRTIDIPILGILKIRREGGRPLITPDFESSRMIAAAGADMIAIEASNELHAEHVALRMLIRAIHDDLGLPVMADISTVEEAHRAAECGADWVGTTLSGYTSATTHLPHDAPDFELLAAMVGAGIPAVLEGHVRTPDDVAAARAIGARAIVVGTAITNTRAITAAFDARSPVS